MYEGERRKIIQRIFPAFESGGPQFLSRSALLKLLGRGSVAHVLITPVEAGVTDEVAQILAYLSGLERAGAVDTVVVAEDMEEVSAGDRLARLRDSIAGRVAPNGVDPGNSVSSGRYYRLYRLSKPAGVKAPADRAGYRGAKPDQQARRRGLRDLHGPQRTSRRGITPSSNA